jgi:hypothetical protein
VLLTITQSFCAKGILCISKIGANAIPLFIAIELKVVANGERHTEFKKINFEVTHL